MKFLTFFGLLLTHFTSIGQGNNYSTELDKKASIKAVYKLTYQPDSLNRGTVRSEESILLFGEGTSFFTTKNKLLEDSAKQNLVTRMRMQNTGTISIIGMPRSYFYYAIYKDHQRGIFSTVDKIGINAYRYEESRGILNWIILPSKEILLGYNCRKANVYYGGRSYEAWFTEDVPISEGPYKFWGLPGLIVKVNDLQNFYSFELIQLVVLKNNITIPFEAKKVTNASRSVFLKARKDYMENPFIDLGQDGISVSEADKMQYRENIKRRNNYMELK